MFAQHLQKGNCVVLLDGLDEEVNVEWRRIIVDRIKDLVSLRGENCFVVASRPSGYKSTPQIEGFKEGTIRELNKNEIQQLAYAWYERVKFILPTLSKEEPDRFMKALEAQPEINDLASNPLLLTGLLLMHYQGRPLPSRRVEIYQYLVETLIVGWRRRRRPDIDLPLDDTLDLLKPLAFKLIENSSEGLAPEDWVLKQFDEFFMEEHRYTRREVRKKSRERLDTIVEHSELLYQHGAVNGQKVYRFFRKILGEYLTALQMQIEWYKDGEKAETLLKYLHRERWQEVVRLMLGVVSLQGNKTRTTKLLNQIYKLQNDDDDNYEAVLHRNLLLTGECLTEDLRVKPWLVEDIIHGLGELIKGDVYKLRWAASKILGRLRATRHRKVAINLLENILNNERAINVKAAAIEALIALDEYEITKTFLYRFVEYPTGDYSLWALSLLLKNEPRGDILKLLKHHIQREYDQISFYHRAEVKVEDTTGFYSNDNSYIRLWKYLTVEDLIELALTTRENANSQWKREQGEWILFQLSDERSLELVRRLATSAQDKFIRCQAAQELAKENRERAIQILKNVAIEEGEEPIHAARVLDKLGERDLAIQVLRRVIWKPNSKYDLASLGDLTNLQVQELVVPIAMDLYFSNKIKTDKDQWEIIKILSQTGSDELSTELCLNFVHQPEHLYRYEAALKLLETDEEIAVTTLRGIVNREREDDREIAAQTLIYLGKDLETLNEDLQKIAGQPCSPDKKYWVTQALAELKLQIVQNGSSSPISQKPQSVNESSQTPPSIHRLYTIALNQLNELIEQNPQNVDAWLAKARILKLQRQEEDEDALDALNQIIKLAAPDDWIRLQVAKMYQEGWDDKECQAQEILLKLIEIADQPNLCINAAKLLVEWGNQEYAKSALEQAIKLSPKNPWAVADIAILLHKCGKTTDGIVELKKAKSLSEENMSYENKQTLALSIAEELHKSGEKNDAQRMLENVVATEPKRSQILIRAAEIQKIWGQDQKALQIIEQIMLLNSKVPEDWIKIAELLHECNTTETKNEALEALKIAAKLAPEWVYIWGKIAFILEKFGHHEELVDISKKIVDLIPNNASAWDYLGMVYRVLGCYDDAIEACQRARELEPENAYFYLRSGFTYFYKGNYNHAIDVFKQALDLSTKNEDRAICWETIGDAYMSLGDIDKGNAAYHNATGLDPEGININLGYIHMIQKNWDEAENTLIKNIEVAKENDYASFVNLAILRYRQGKKTESQRLFNEALNRCFDQTLHGRIQQAWLQVVTGETAAGLAKLRTVLTEISPSPGFLSMFVWDIDMLESMQTSIPALSEMRHILEETKVAWESNIQSIQE